MLCDIPHLESRAITAENPTGARGAGGYARNGRKGAPCLEKIRPGSVVTLADIRGPGMIRRFWMTIPVEDPSFLRSLVLRMYWDGQEIPSVEAPVGDFFGAMHARLRKLESELISVQNGKSFICRIPMPFASSARITIENDSDQELSMLFFHIDYTLGDEVGPDTGRFHAQFRRVNRQPFHTDYVILDGIKGRGRYLGTMIGVRDACGLDAWWGEGEVKMYFDGEDHPTICGTGAEDYAGFSWGLSEGTFPLHGCPLCDNAHGYYSEYRWHVPDPVIFEESIKVTIMQMGYGSGREAEAAFGDDYIRFTAAGGDPEGDLCFYDRSDDYCSVAYWYQTLPTNPFPPFPSREERLRDLLLEKAGE